jgi:hypothetical protein
MQPAIFDSAQGDSIPNNHHGWHCSQWAIGSTPECNTGKQQLWGNCTAQCSTKQTTHETASGAAMLLQHSTAAFDNTA